MNSGDVMVTSQYFTCCCWRSPNMRITISADEPLLSFVFVSAASWQSGDLARNTPSLNTALLCFLHCLEVWRAPHADWSSCTKNSFRFPPICPKIRKIRKILIHYLQEQWCGCAVGLFDGSMETTLVNVTLCWPCTGVSWWLCRGSNQV